MEVARSQVGELGNRGCQAQGKRLKCFVNRWCQISIFGSDQPRKIVYEGPNLLMPVKNQASHIDSACPMVNPSFVAQIFIVSRDSPARWRNRL